MKPTLGASLFIVVNIMLVTAFEKEAIFEDEDIYGEALPRVWYPTIIFPGTKWCGRGNRAENYDDLGKYREEDKCCREHDHCEGIILPKGTLHSLFNPSILPRLNCECEEKLMNCLQKVDSITSNTIGTGYFAAMDKCFKLEHPALECHKYQKVAFGKRCIKYKFDATQPMAWQYFDNPFYCSKK